MRLMLHGRGRDFTSVKMSYDLDKAKWVTANKKCLAMIKNIIEPALVGSIPDCDTVAECFEWIELVHWLFKDLCHPADYREVRWWWHKRAHIKDEQSGI
jgi:hypothetical protein